VQPDERAQDPDPQHDADRHGYRRIGDIEDVETPRADADVGEIDDIAEHDPVHEVADGAAEQEPERERHDPAAPARGELEAGEDAGDRDGDDREDDRRPLEQAEQAAPIVDVVDAQPVADDLARRIHRVIRDHVLLEQLVADRDECREEHEDGEGGTSPRICGLRWVRFARVQLGLRETVPWCWA
jgi:hypothetical protein